MSRYPELGGAFSAIHANLSESDTRLCRLLECRLSHLDEWARTAADGEERDLLLQLLDSIHPDRDIPIPNDVPAENREALRLFYRDLSMSERLCLLRFLIERRGSEPFADPVSEGFELSERAAEKIAYVQNTFSDNAYLQFSAELGRPRAAYFDSFSDVCEEVYNGICEYGILPILHERDGKLFRFYGLLQKYDLRIVCACDVPCVERGGVTVTRYALIRKTLPAPRGGTATHIELSLPADGGFALCDLLQAARACDLTPVRLDTRAVGDGDRPEESAHQITLTLPDADLSPALFLAYLSLELPRCTVLGLYRVLED